MTDTQPRQVPKISLPELTSLVLEQYDDEAARQVAEWHLRGDAVVIYSNHDLGHQLLGHRVFFPVGPQCTITEVPLAGSSCPVQLPGGMMSWRYYIDYVCDGAS